MSGVEAAALALEAASPNVPSSDLFDISQKILDIVRSELEAERSNPKMPRPTNRSAVLMVLILEHTALHDTLHLLDKLRPRMDNTELSKALRQTVEVLSENFEKLSKLLLRSKKEPPTRARLYTALVGKTRIDQHLVEMIPNARRAREILQLASLQTEKMSYEIQHLVEKSRCDLGALEGALGEMAESAYGQKYGAKQPQFSKPLPRTGDWLFKHSRFLGWSHSKRPGTLWISGQPGSGKSMLMCHLVEWLKKDTVYGDAVVYFQFDSDANTTPYHAMESLLHQLSSSGDSLRPTFARRWRDPRTKKSLFKNDNMRVSLISKEFFKCVQDFHLVTVCLDALDECTDPKELANVLERFASSPCRLAVAATRLPFGGLMLRKIIRIVVNDENENDIKTYVRCFLQGNPKLTDIMDESLRSDVENLIANKADGSFLWTKFQLEELLNQTTTYELRQCLAELPQDLDSTWVRLLARIKAQPRNQANLAKRVLSWLSFAMRPLSLSELQEVLSIDTETGSVDPERSPSAWAIKEVCIGLVTFDEKRGSVRFTHHYLGDHLKSLRGKLFPTGEAEVARCCLAYLADEEFSSGACEDVESYKERLQRRPFSVYAAEYWGIHLKRYFEDGPDQYRAEDMMKMALLTRLPSLEAMTQILYASRQMQISNPQDFPRDFSPFHMSAHYGLVGIMEYLAKTQESSLLELEINSQDSWGRTPLHIAAETGNRRACETLLGLRAGVNIHDNQHRSPLTCAVIGGHENVVKLLLKNDAKVGGKIGADLSKSIIEYAAENGNINIMESLLVIAESEEDVGDALCLAASGGHFEVVKLLLASKWKHGVGQALLKAVENGSTDVVSVLYEAGSDILASDKQGLTPLHHAAALGHTDLIKLLIRGGSPLDIQDKKGRTPLLLAAEKGLENAVRLLVERGAKIELEDENGCTAIDLSAGNGHFEVVRYLLDHSVRPTFSGTCGGSESSDSKQPDTQHPNAIQAASQKGYTSIVRLLLEKFADPNDCGITGRTPLSYAAEGGHRSVVELLLETRAVDPNSFDGKKRTPLSYAAEAGHSSVVGLLLSTHQVDVESTDVSGRTALSYASANRHDYVEALLRRQTGVEEEKGGRARNTTGEDASEAVATKDPLEHHQLEWDSEDSPSDTL